MRRPRRAARTVLTVLLLQACAGGCAPSNELALRDAEAGIREVTRRWEASLLAGEAAQAVADVFTEDAVRLPANEPVVRGHAAIMEALAGSVALAEARFDIEDLEVDGRLAFTAGTYRVRPPDGPPLTGKFLQVWKRTPAGWRIHRVMWD